MDIQQAFDILTKEQNTDHIKYFKEQVSINSLQPSNSLTELLDKINDNTLTWLQNLPNKAKTKPTLRKYKVALCVLLDNDTVKQSLGAKYCADTHANINQCFKHNIDTIINQRQTTQTVHNDTDMNSETTDNVSDSDTDSVEIAQPSNHTMDDDSENNVSCLEAKLQQLITRIKVLETSNYHLTKHNKKLWDIVKNLTSK